MDAETPEEQDVELELLAELRRTVAGCYSGARRALRMARRYREEEGRAGGRREAACVIQARTWRDEARALRTLSGGSREEARAIFVARPGVARASVRAVPKSTKTG